MNNALIVIPCLLTAVYSLPIRPFHALLATRPTNHNSCQYLQNISATETLNNHQYEILEQCLYYFLAAEAQTKKEISGNINAIASLPPQTSERNSLSNVIPINFHQITLQHFQLDEFNKEIRIQGYIELSWLDKRLSWNVEEWNLQQLNINSISHVWVPLIASQSFETAIRNGDVIEMRKITALNNGTVKALINFSLKTFCDDTDFINFPDDVYKCCFQLEPHLGQTEFKTDSKPIFTDPRHFRTYGWLMSGSTPTVRNDSADIVQLSFCMNLKRATNSIRIELTVPVTVASILFLLCPLMGKIQTQIPIKLFILLLQFITLQIFSSRISTHFGSAAGAPKILQFHELSIILNSLSISVSVILWTLSRIQRRVPPWSWLINFSQLINGFLFTLNMNDAAIGELEMEKVETTNPTKADWLNAFNALHCAAGLVISFFLIIGYIFLV